MRIGRLIIGAIAASLVCAVGAYAQPREHGWHGDMRHFHERDFAYWRGSASGSRSRPAKISLNSRSRSV